MLNQNISKVSLWGIPYDPKLFSRNKTLQELDNSKLGSIQQWMTLTCCQDHILTENIWFVWSETSYCGDERRCYRCGTNNQPTKQTLKIELLSQWKLKADFRNYDHLVESGVGNKKDLLKPAFCYTLRYHHWKAIMFSVVRPGLSTWIWISQRSQLRPVGTCNRDS